MQEKIIKLKDRRIICENTIGMWFDRSEIDYDFEPGQYAKISLLEPIHQDDEGNSRLFSIANSPLRKDILMFSTRAADSAFNKNIMQMPIGSPASISEPGGNTNLHTDYSIPAVFLIGGIGITPVRSMVEHFVLSGLPYEMTLFYSNKNKSLMAFFDEFENWDALHNGFSFIPTVEDFNESYWNYEYGFISDAMICKYVKDFAKPIFYIVGPPAMVDNMEKILLSNKVKPENIKLERFG